MLKEDHSAIVSSSIELNQKIEVSSYNAFTNKDIVTWNSEDGVDRLLESNCSKNFFHIVNFYQPQIAKNYSEIASAVIVLNALYIPKDTETNIIELEEDIVDIDSDSLVSDPCFSQRKFLNKNNSHIQKQEDLSSGIELFKLKELIESHSAKVQVTKLVKESESYLAMMREDIVNAMLSKDRFIIAKFNSEKMGVGTANHTSPIVAYHQKTDSVLMMDVSSYKNTWYWVELKDLFSAVAGSDFSEDVGYLTVLKPFK